MHIPVGPVVSWDSGLVCIPATILLRKDFPCQFCRLPFTGQIYLKASHYPFNGKIRRQGNKKELYRRGNAGLTIR